MPYMRWNVHRINAVKTFKIFLLTLPFCLSFMAQANPNTDAGTVRQQIEGHSAPELPKQTDPLGEKPQPDSDEQEGVTVELTGFTFTGNTLLESSALSEALSDFLNRPLSFAELQQTAQVVTEQYRENGWIVQTYLPPQEIQNGVLEIKIVEALFGEIKVEGEPPKRISKDQLQGHIDGVQSKGDPLDAKKFDRKLLLMDDLPGVIVSGSLKKGEGQNETDLMISTADEPFFTGEARLSNEGARSTGYAELATDLYFASPFKQGDNATVNLTKSEGTEYGKLSYSIPISYDGWRVGVSATHLDYDVVHDSFNGLDAKGSSSSWGVNAKYPLIRSYKQNLYASLYADKERFDNEAGQVTTSNYETGSVSFGLSANQFDRFMGGGANSLGLKLTKGEVDLKTVDISEDESVDGAYTKLTYYLSRHQHLVNDWSLYVLLTGQEASTNLDSSEKMYLGGPYGVRAYPVNEAGGDEGELINIELRDRLTSNLLFTGFFDWGKVTRQKANVNALAPNDVTLKGYGLSLAWISQAGFSLKGTWAHRIGGNENPTAEGNDQDGSLHTNRYWLQASTRF